MTLWATRLGGRSHIDPSPMTECKRPNRGWRRTPAARAFAFFAAVTVAATSGPSVPARAQMPPGIPMIRDAEVEQLLRDYSQPILRAAGLAQQNIRVIIIN